MFCVASQASGKRIVAISGSVAVHWFVVRKINLIDKKSDRAELKRNLLCLRIQILPIAAEVKSHCRAAIMEARLAENLA